MTFWRSVPGAIVLLVVFGGLAALGMAGAQVYRVTHPARQPELALNLATTLSKAEDVTFKSTDGVRLSGWLFHGVAGSARWCSATISARARTRSSTSRSR